MAFVFVRMNIRKILAGSILAVMFASPAKSETDYDPQHTMLALNMAVVSVHRILAAESRIVLDDEYQNIINNLSIGNIRSDPEITDLYRKLLDAAQNKKLRQEESELLKKSSDKQSGRRIKTALSEMAENSRRMLTGETGIGSFFVGLGRLAGACTASYFKYQTVNETVEGESLEEGLFRLNAEEMRDFNELQKQLLSSSWNLLNKYRLPDEFRLVQRALDDFYRAVEEPDTSSRRLRMLKALEDDFRIYPPYWFYRARAALDEKNDYEAQRSFARFMEVWRPVLRKDPYMLEAAKYKVSTLLKDGLPEDEESQKKILELSQIIRDNTMREDWENNLFLAALYYSLGDSENAIECAQVNIDFGYETEISSAMLSKMREGVEFPLLPEETLRLLRLENYFSGMTPEDREAAFLVADYFDGRYGAVEALGRNSRPLALHARRIIEFLKADASSRDNIHALAELELSLKAELSDSYSEIFEMVKDYADNENIPARIFLADMYNYGWGVERDTRQAMNYYAKSSSEIYSQFMYVNLMLLSQDNTVNVEFENDYSTAMRYYNARDYAKAAEIFTVSAKNGNPSSQYMIGRMHEHGQSVEKNIETARSWYTEAAKNNEPRAKRALKRLSGKKSWWPF